MPNWDIWAGFIWLDEWRSSAKVKRLKSLRLVTDRDILDLI